MKLDRSDPAGKVAEHHRSGTGTTRVPYPIQVRRVRIADRTYVTPRMLRLTVAGPELAGLHTYQCDDHVRIVFADPDGTRRDPVPNDHDMLDWPDPMPTTRKYTIRRYDADTGRLDLDFVVHAGGLASDWAASAAVGDEVTIAGPPGAKAFAHTYDHYVFAVDLTALPAAARWLEESPPDVSADVVVETADATDRDYPLAVRDRVRVHWVGPAQLTSTVESLPLPTGRPFLFAAGEADDIRPLRAFRGDTLVTGYWKRGVAEFEH